MQQSAQRKAVFAFGIVFMIAMLTLAIAFPTPTPFQYTVFRIVLALACAGIAGMFPGFLIAEIPGGVRAGGALAVFVIVYFNSPAPLAGIQVPRTTREIIVNLHRSGFSMDCPTLPEASRLEVISTNGVPEISSIKLSACKASFTVNASRTGLARLRILDATPYALVNANETYSFEDSKWEGSITDTPGMRLLVSLFSYAGQCQKLAEAHAIFETILRSKAQSLRGLFIDGDQRYDYLQGVNVIATGQASTMSTQEVHVYWKGNGLLQVLSGLCISRPDGELMRSSIFSGALAGTLPEPYVIDLKVDSSEFSTTRDLYSALMLFALAQEAKARNLDQDLIISYLERAREVTTQIRDAAGAPLLAAINRALSDAGAPTEKLTR